MDFDNTPFTDDYYDVILNTIFSRLPIKKLMCYMKNKVEENTVLYYSKRLNFLFYKTTIDRFHSNYFDVDNKMIFRNEVYRIILRESVEVPIYNKLEFSDEELYEKAIIYCQENKIVFYDDTDITEYSDIKEKYDTKERYIEPKEFESIEEIIEYLEKYTKAEYKKPTPDYYIDKGRVISFAGSLCYDTRVFKIPGYLEENNYVDRKYYNRENYGEFFEEDWKTWNYEELDFPRLSYLILRTFNVERMSEGVVDNLIKSGILLKLLKRTIELKTNDKC